MASLHETLRRPPRARDKARTRVAHIVHSPDAKAVGRILPLDGRTWLIGRGVEGEGGVEDALMSREHARLFQLNGDDYVGDLETSNGTFADGASVEKPRVISGNTVLSLGSTLLVIDEDRDVAGLPAAAAIEETGLEAEVIGVSLASQRLREAIAILAKSKCTVLLLGPTGSGKEVAAQAIHRASEQRSGPFVAVNCAAVPTEIAESEFFGHKKGAFTGATSDRDGYFVQASGGTLFLDEIGDLAPQHQAKLLRVLEDQTVRPLGGSATEKVDVRIVAATNVDLEQSTFRKDLLARLADWTLRVPPLAERKADVLTLWKHFIRADAPNAAATAMTSDFAEALLLHAWPMNIRELRKLARRLGMVVRDGPFDLELLPEEIRSAVQARDAASMAAAAETSTSDADAPERAALDSALARAKGNVRRAASELGVHRTQLYRWLRRFGIDPDVYR